MLKMLPSAVFWGFKVVSLDENKCAVSIPYSWRTQNPFKSIYFAALAGAAELSTGALCQMYLSDRSPHSMLVIGFRAEYSKKANSKIVFTCDQGLELGKLLDSFDKSGDHGSLEMISIGKNEKGEEVARAFISWSFKKK